MADIELTDEERRAIASLKRVAKKWPATLWLFCGGQSGIAVMRTHEDGGHAHLSTSGVDPAYIVDEIQGIDSDGGDW